MTNQNTPPSSGSTWARILRVSGTSVLAIAVAGIGAGATLWGIGIQNTSLKEQEGRETRATVYQEFLASADTLAAAHSLATAVEKQGFCLPLTGPGAEAPSISMTALPCADSPAAADKRVKAAVDEVLSARTQFQKTMNMVYVFGTASTRGSAQEIKKSLPDNPAPMILTKDIRGFAKQSIDAKAFRAGYKKFIDSSCADLNLGGAASCKD